MANETENNDFDDDNEGQVSVSEQGDDDADFVGGEFEDDETEANEDGLRTRGTFKCTFWGLKLN